MEHDKMRTDADIIEESEQRGHAGKGCRRWPTSYLLQEPDQVFDALGVQPGQTVLDLGCGIGDYALRLAELVGPEGVVHALDKGEDALERLAHEAGSRGLGNIRILRRDMTEPLPFEDGSLDLCLMATVLHALEGGGHGRAAIGHAARALRKTGRLAVLECKKEEQPWGPPKGLRLSPEQVEALAAPTGLKRLAYHDLGRTYLLTLG